jgi:hypothetical protein
MSYLDYGQWNPQVETQPQPPKSSFLNLQGDKKGKYDDIIKAALLALGVIAPSLMEEDPLSANASAYSSGGFKGAPHIQLPEQESKYKALLSRLIR